MSDNRMGSCVCDRDGCEAPATGHDAWGMWCEEHNGLDGSAPSIGECGETRRTPAAESTCEGHETRTPRPLREEPGIPLVKGPSTYTTACTCDSQIQGYHRMNCGVYA